MAFEPVERYMWTGTHIDFEMITAIDYSSILNEQRLEPVITLLSSNRNKYPDNELMFLFLRSMASVTWKLDVLLLTHLEQCASANSEWNQLLAYLSHNKLEGNCFSFDKLPYWLKNVSDHFISALPAELKEKFNQIEVVMIKSNDIQAQCKLIGNTHIITLDSGLYTFLSEWCKLLIHGYRLKQYCQKNDWSLTDPIKSCANLFIAIVEALRGNGSIYRLPMPAMNFNFNDSLIVKDILQYQIQFMLGHEFSHIIKHVNLDAPYNKAIELEADSFSLEMLKRVDFNVSILNRPNATTQISEEENDIQSKHKHDKKIECIEILFSFFDLFYYTCHKLGYPLISNTTHPKIKTRRQNLYKQYTPTHVSPLINYIDYLSPQIKNQIEIFIKERKGEP